MTPFNVRQKQEGTKTNAAVAYIRYIEINLNGNQYRLLKKTSAFSKIIPFTLNGISKSAPYTDPSDPSGINIFVTGGKLVFSTVFGLTITWDGVSKSDQSLCDIYSTYVCGLCGNGDGKILLLKLCFLFKTIKTNYKRKFNERFYW